MYCCPDCNGEDVRTLSVIYDSGVSNVNISGDYVGFGRNGWGCVEASGKKVSRLAQSCAPPEKFSFVHFLALIVLAVAWCGLAKLGTTVVLGAIGIFILIIYSILNIFLTFFNINIFEFQPTPLFNWLEEDTTWKAIVSIPIVLALIGWTLVFMWRYNRTTWVQEYRKWQNTFMCLRCGTKFFVR